MVWIKIYSITSWNFSVIFFESRLVRPWFQPILLVQLLIKCEIPVLINYGNLFILYTNTILNIILYFHLPSFEYFDNSSFALSTNLGLYIKP